MRDATHTRQPEGQRPFLAGILTVVILVATILVITPQLAQGQSTGAIDFTANQQQIDGFGFANPFGRSGYVMNSPAIQQAVVDAFFNPITGAGVSMLRFGIITDSNIEPTSPGSPGAAPTYVWDGADGGQVWFAQQAQKYGVNRFYLDSWGAPAFMKTNNNTNNGGQICGMPGAAACASGDWRQAYANFLVQHLTFYSQAGIPVTEASFVNEPDQNVSYASLTLSTAQVLDFIKNYWGPTVMASGLNVKLVCCDHSNWNGARTYATAVNNDPLASQYISTYSGHEYGVTANSVLIAGNPKKVWMSEWASSGTNAFNATWDTPTTATNDGMNLATDISNALTNGFVSAYLYWYGDSTGATGGFFSLSDTSNATSYVLTKRLYALASFARFVRPGAFRVSASTNNSNLRINAFRNDNGKKVIELVNRNTSTITLNLSVDVGTANWIPVSYLTDENNAIAPVNAAVLGGQTLTVTLSPRSLTVVTLTPPPVDGTVQLVTTATLQKFGDGGYQAALKISNTGSGTAQSVHLEAAALGPAAGSTLPAAPLPLMLGDIAPGSYAVATVNYTPDAGSSGSRVIERYSGSYAGGTFGASIRAVLP